MSGDKELGGFSRHSPNEFETATLLRSVFIKKMKEKIILGTTVFILTATLIFIFGGIVIKLTNQPKFIAPLGQATSGIPSTLAIATTTAVSTSE